MPSKRYVEHPAHVGFGEWLAERSVQWIVFDYALDSSTVIVP